MMRSIGLFLGLFLVCACGSKTTVILLPQEDGKTGSVIVKNQSFSTTLDQPYTYAKVSDGQSDFPVKSIDEKRVTDVFQRLLEAEPLKPQAISVNLSGKRHMRTNRTMVSVPSVIPPR